MEAKLYEVFFPKVSNYCCEGVIMRREKSNIALFFRFQLCHWTQVAPELYLADMITMFVNKDRNIRTS